MLSFIGRRKKLSAFIAGALAVLAFMPAWVEPTWGLFSNEPLVPILGQHIDVAFLPDWRVGDVLQYLPGLITVALLVVLLNNSRTRPVTPDLDQEIHGVLFRRHAVGPNVWAPAKWLCPKHGIELQDASIEGHQRPIPPRQIHSFATRNDIIDTVRCAGFGDDPPHLITHRDIPTQMGNYWLSLADANVRLDAKQREAKAAARGLV